MKPGVWVNTAAGLGLWCLVCALFLVARADVFLRPATHMWIAPNSVVKTTCDTSCVASNPCTLVGNVDLGDCTVFVKGGLYNESVNVHFSTQGATVAFVGVDTTPIVMKLDASFLTTWNSPPVPTMSFQQLSWSINNRDYSWFLAAANIGFKSTMITISDSGTFNLNPLVSTTGSTWILQDSKFEALFTDQLLLRVNNAPSGGLDINIMNSTFKGGSYAFSDPTKATAVFGWNVNVTDSTFEDQISAFQINAKQYNIQSSTFTNIKNSLFQTTIDALTGLNRVEISNCTFYGSVLAGGTTTSSFNNLGAPDFNASALDTNTFIATSSKFYQFGLGNIKYKKINLENLYFSEPAGAITSTGLTDTPHVVNCTFERNTVLNVNFAIMGVPGTAFPLHMSGNKFIDLNPANVGALQLYLYGNDVKWTTTTDSNLIVDALFVYQGLEFNGDLEIKKNLFISAGDIVSTTNAGSHWTFHSINAIGISGVEMHPDSSFTYWVSDPVKGITVNDTTPAWKIPSNLKIKWPVGSTPPIEPALNAVYDVLPLASCIQSVQVSDYNENFTASIIFPSGTIQPLKFKIDSLNCEACLNPLHNPCQIRSPCECGIGWGGPFCDCTTVGLPDFGVCRQTGGQVWVFDDPAVLNSTAPPLIVPPNYNATFLSGLQVSGDIILQENSTLTVGGVFEHQGSLNVTGKLSGELIGDICFVYPTTTLHSGSFKFQAGSTVNLDFALEEVIANGCMASAKRVIFDENKFAALNANKSITSGSNWTINLHNIVTTPTDTSPTASPAPETLVETEVPVEPQSSSPCPTTSPVPVEAPVAPVPTITRPAPGARPPPSIRIGGVISDDELRRDSTAPNATIPDIKIEILRTSNPEESSGTIEGLEVSIPEGKCSKTENSPGLLSLFVTSCSTPGTPSTPETIKQGGSLKWWYWGIPVVIVGVLVIVGVILVLTVKPIKMAIMPYKGSKV